MDDSNAPATKSDLNALEARFTATVEEKTQSLEDHLVEQIRDSETKFLKAFYTFAESNQARLASIETESDAM